MAKALTSTSRCICHDDYGLEPWGGASGHTYTFTQRPDGKTDLDAVVVRDGKNLRGQVLGFVLGTVGKLVLEKAFDNTVKAIEARNAETGPQGEA